MPNAASILIKQLVWQVTQEKTVCTPTLNSWKITFYIQYLFSMLVLVYWQAPEHYKTHKLNMQVPQDSMIIKTTALL